MLAIDTKSPQKYADFGKQKKDFIFMKSRGLQNDPICFKTWFQVPIHNKVLAVKSHKTFTAKAFEQS